MNKAANMPHHYDVIDRPAQLCHLWPQNLEPPTVTARTVTIFIQACAIHMAFPALVCTGGSCVSYMPSSGAVVVTIL